MNPEAGGEHLYGADKNGLIWGYCFSPGEPAKPIDAESLLDRVAKATPSGPGSFFWLHFATSAASERWMRGNLDLPETFHESLHEEAGSTRLEQEDRSLVAVIHDVLFDFTFDPADVSTVILCINPQLVVSARLKPLRSVDRLRAAVRAGHLFRSSTELLAHLLRDQANVLVDIVRRSTARVNSIEDQLLDNRISTNRRDMGALRRVLVRFQRLLAPEPAALFRLLNRPPDWIGGDDLQDLRQAAEEFSTAVSDSTALAERVKLLQEEVGALINEQTGRTLFILTIVTVIALPINLVAGLFGMNVGGIPLGTHPHGFLVIVGALMAMTSGLAWVAIRGRK
ncbi:MAG TPA: transporter [Fibrobacteria bacterium]|nr:transporter [Fibrobacteria bacterium]